MMGRFVSPLAKETNRRLWNDLNEDDTDEAGILTRVRDRIDYWRVAVNGSKNFRRTKRVSASFIHASMRAPNTVFHDSKGDWKYAIPALLVGSKFRHRDHNIADGRMKDQPFVDCALYYPANAGTGELGLRVKMKANGKGCHRDTMKKLCFKNNTCSELVNIDCSCNSTKVPPHMIGDHFTELFSDPANDTDFHNFYAGTVCSYPGTEQGLHDMIAASNSLWKQRHGWCRFRKQLCHTLERKYRGHTECMASKNMMEMVDGILIQMPLPRAFERQVTLEQLDPIVQDSLQKDLQALYDLGRKELPIVFMEEIQGMSPEACQRYWGGVDCQDGYRKEVYTQAFNFSNGACIASPPGCSEVYYFPADNRTGTCVPILQNRTCHFQKAMLEDGGSFPRILCMPQIYGVGYLLAFVWLMVVLLDKKRTHRILSTVVALWRVFVAVIQERWPDQR